MIPSVVMPRAPEGWQRFHHPVGVFRADDPGDIIPLLLHVESAVDAGLHAAGFLSYEAAPGLDRAAVTRELTGLPLAWFALFRETEPILLEDMDVDACATSEWTPSISEAEYREAVARIRRYLQAGDTYQVNFSFRLKSQFLGDPRAFWLRLHRAQQARYSAFIETDDFSLCSASPELFFRLDGDTLLSRPMKGTSRRGMTPAQDDRLARELEKSTKNRAENVMIVDMVRNDMGRVAEPGSVHVPRLFDVERYPTVLQMTSTVESQTSAGFVDIMRALFPCASITGAPKIRTMEIIRELETLPRGIYTGAMGYLSPGREALFNVAIRTAHIDPHSGQAEYGVGGGIVWDSVDEQEYEECRAKAAVLTTARPDFELLETLRWEPSAGYYLLERHMARLGNSAEYFGVPLDMDTVRAELEHAASGFGDECRRVRLSVSETGRPTVEHTRLRSRTTPTWRVTFAKEAANSQDIFLYHKTTNRDVYENARLACPELDDVILWNERGEVTESTVANVVIETAGQRVTPPVESGLLAGVLRAELLAERVIQEQVLTRDDVRAADRIFLVNSVRKWIAAELVE